MKMKIGSRRGGKKWKSSRIKSKKPRKERKSSYISPKKTTLIKDFINDDRIVRSISNLFLTSNRNLLDSKTPSLIHLSFKGRHRPRNNSSRQIPPPSKNLRLRLQNLLANCPTNNLPKFSLPLSSLSKIPDCGLPGCSQTLVKSAILSIKRKCSKT